MHVLVQFGLDNNCLLFLKILNRLYIFNSPMKSVFQIYTALKLAKAGLHWVGDRRVALLVS